ncbi:hypothetical protein LCGC14_1998080 [marine sediment metagenome]|uniref:YopX protein domain-containing protein n=1 Tax=marine sediment metagenome TaxID=412755 RepID=A0A0F9F3V2_9ZZZZ
MEKRFTGEYTRKKEPIYEDDIVMYCWGCATYNGKRIHEYQYHKITFRGLAFRLGQSYNIWSGKDVIKVDKVPEGVLLDDTETDIDGNILLLDDFWKTQPSFSEFLKEEYPGIEKFI